MNQVVTGEKKVSYNPFATGPLFLAVPTTESQREIWSTLPMDENASLCYNESIVISFKGKTDYQYLNLAFQEVLKRHDALRSVFSGDGKTFLVPEFRPNTIETEAWVSKDRFEKLKQEAVEYNFDLIKGPCIKGLYLKESEDQSYLILTAHHLICDGWSFAVILSELGSYYSQLVEGRKVSIEIGEQFSAYAMEESLHGQTKEHKKFWLNEFSGPLAVQPLPLDFIRPKFRTYDSRRIDFHFQTEVVAGLKRLAAKEGCSLYTVLMGIHHLLIHNISSSHEIVTGMASASQSNTGKMELVGHLVNLLPLRMKIDSQMTFSQLLKSLRTKMLDAFDHQEYGYGSLLKDLNLKRNPSEIPLLNTVFNIDQQSPGQGLNFKEIHASYTTTPRVFENFELFFNAVSCGTTLSLECQYNSNLFKPETIKNWLECYNELAGIIIQNPGLTLESIKTPKLIIPNQKVTTVTKQTDHKRHPEVESKVTAIWEKVLRLNNLQATDNFFSLGGHSLLAVEVASLIKEEFKAQFTIKDVFEAPTIMEMAARLAEISKPSVSVLPVTRIESNQGSLGHNQMQIWYLEEIYSGTMMHNLPSSIRLKFKVEPKLLEETLQILTQRHEAFRTGIIKQNGGPVQVIMVKHDPACTARLEVQSATEENIVDLLRDESNFVFNKETPPLYRAKLFKLSEDDFVFFFMVHHSIWDGWSFDIFFEELDLIYSALARGERPVFTKEPGIRYLDYTAWMSKMLSSGNFDHQLAYWKRKLEPELPVIELPLDHKRPLVVSNVGAAVPFTLSKETDELLRRFAKENSTSVFNVLLTAFKITLARYSGISDIIVGSPVRARNNPDLLHTIGYFVNTVALRSAVDLSLSFEEVLKVVNTTCLEAFSNQDLPFQVVLNELSYEKDASRTPIFQSFFSYQDVSNRGSRLNGHKYSQINVDKASTHTDLDLWIKTSDLKIEGAFEYRIDLFNRISIERFKDCFLLVIENLFNNKARVLKDVACLPVNQKELILNEWNNTESSTSEFQPFIKYFEKNAAIMPEKIAIENSQGSYTYGELNKLANKCAHGLIGKGIEGGNFVGISVTRNLNLLVAILGTLKAGAGYVPLDPAFPQDRLDYMIESSKPKIIVTDKFLETILYDASLSVVNPEKQLSLKDPMYVIYTSGSTGKPKGVQVSQGAMTNFLTSMSKKPGITKSDKLLAVTTLSFDIATLELYMPLMNGASIFLATSYEVLDGQALKNIIETHDINYMQATPSTWRLLLSAGWQPRKDFKILCGGEPFPKDLAQKLSHHSSSVWNMYGPTETTVWSTCKEIKPDTDAVTLGHPIDNTYAYILNENLQLSPIGTAGELYLGGLGLADGYFGSPAMTNEKFVPNPFRPGEKMYATGDFARFLADGDIECLGRRDGQVKVRGYRIELGEIEATLARLNGIQEAAVITMEVKPEDVRIIAFLVTQNEIDDRKLREDLSETLPKYMIPSHFVKIRELPKTLNAKIDKKRLPSFFQTESVSSTEEIVETQPVAGSDSLTRIWQEVLGRDDFPKDKSFFDIGGNSLMAVQLFTKIARKMGHDLPLVFLLENPTFESFAARLESRNKVVTSHLPQTFKSLVAIKPQGSKSPLYCFHGVGGNILNYIKLSPSTGDRPLIALQSRGLDGSETLDSIESMATEYIKELRIMQPKGPYYLAGGSMGGMIALESAIQLTKMGEKVEKLIMLDTFGPDVNIKSYDKSERSFWKNLKISFYYRRKMFLNNLRVKILKLLGVPVPLESRLFDLEMTNYRALWKYRPEVYEGDLFLIRGKLKPHGWYSDPNMGWSKTIKGKINTFEIHGSHNDFVESPELGPVLQRLL